jgi:dTDP-4-dehydrorhamnose reductase
VIATPGGRKLKILILGGSGMLGHQLWKTLGREHETWVTVRKSASQFPDYSEFPKRYVRPDVDAMIFDEVTRALASIQPDLVINCIGLIKQNPMVNDPLSSIQLNALLPHRISLICRTADIRMIHISTDCVFSGKKGSYLESDQSDAEDLYGRTKFLGELSYAHTLTLRTSIIGRELAQYKSLLEWFLSQKGKTVKGYTRVIFSGVTTIYLAKVVAKLIRDRKELTGVYHVASPAISKHDLLCMVRDAYKLDVEIVPDDREVSDRSLTGEKFIKTSGYGYPAWTDMVTELADDPTPYDEWRS